MQCPQRKPKNYYIKKSSPLFHQPSPRGPHSQSFAIYIQWDREQQTRYMNTPEGDKHGFRAICFKPAIDKEGKDETMEDVCFFLTPLASTVLGGE